MKTDDPQTNGCPPAGPVTDRDNDGVPDNEDACPDVPGVRMSDPKTNGCPPDSDHDGMANKSDVGGPEILYDAKVNGKTVKAVAGELHIRDLPGRGCIFTIDLPKQLPRPTPIRARQSTRSRDGGGNA